MLVIKGDPEWHAHVWERLNDAFKTNAGVLTDEGIYLMFLNELDASVRVYYNSETSHYNVYRVDKWYPGALICSIPGDLLPGLFDGC